MPAWTISRESAAKILLSIRRLDTVIDVYKRQIHILLTQRPWVAPSGTAVFLARSAVFSAGIVKCDTCLLYTSEISVLEKAVKSYEKHEKDADRFIALIDKYENFDKLTVAMLNEFVEKILVHERDRKGSIQTTQEVEIYFNFVGKFVPPAFGEVELTPEELEEIRKREERKDKLHQNYLKRKASGAQKRYEDKVKAKKKAEIDAKKAAIRAEDIARGVFVPVSSLPQREPQKGAQTA